MRPEDAVRLRKASAAVTKATSRRDLLVARRDTTIREARHAGATFRHLAAATGLSVTMVKKITDREA